MAQRIKPVPYIVADLAQAEGALAEMAALDRDLAYIEVEMRERIDAAKAEASQKSLTLVTRRKELADAIAVFAKLNREKLFGKAKSLDLGFGVIGFRLSTKIAQMRGITVEMTLEKLREFGMNDGIRIKEEVNKEAALGWPDERLEIVGLRRQQADTFFIEVKKDAIPADA
ncbi:host-nuclease inhibitor Gam family protein [uncultured Desulfovibrio sp.]|uniref:host-nuclease inhibitor Gam family protein n=1 Tax=uncultured Desulfovibrio sp. TaxID=167968 RepID=UPI00261D4F58|nr:host-nuclease inhibitor Gam family protein [uncultured Desulfovibrio sp.]